MSVYVEAYPVFACTGSSSFPKPLSPKEEQSCLERMRQGDTAARDTLVEHNLRLVAHIVKKYATGNDTEDFISIGTVGLMKAVLSFHPDKSTRLATYAARCIENEILMYFRSSKKYRGDLSLQEPITRDKDGNEVTILDTLSQQEAPFSDCLEKNCQLSALSGYLAALPPRQRQVLILRYGLDGGEERPQREVAKALGISRSYISRIEKKAIETLREALAKDDLLF